jgi:small neutral amino acid transporter SnatA (MarC family)
LAHPLLAIINPLEALPVFLKLLEGKNEEEYRRVARCRFFRLDDGDGIDLPRRD